MLDTFPHLKAAFATDSLTWVDADLAWARHLAVYDLTPTRADFLETVTFRKPSSQLAARVAGLGDAGVLFTTGLSERDAMALVAAGTFPVVIEHRRSIHDIITRLQKLMRRDPPLWMCRVLRYGAPCHDQL